MSRIYPNIGDKLYLQQRTGNYYVDLCKNPYTVIGIEKGQVIIQEAQLIFNGPRYYDTVADEIKPDPNGEILKLNWSPKKQCWLIDRYGTGYPQYAYFGTYEHQPYLD